MSARWRRTKRYLRSDILKAFNGSRSNGNRVFRIKNVKHKSLRSLCKGRITGVNGAGKLKEPEPLIDVFDEKDEIVVVAEFAGFSRENLRVDVQDQKLTLSAHASDRKYYKSLNLPSRVISETLRLAHKNGVLEIRVKKAVEKAIEEKAMDRVAG